MGQPLRLLLIEDSQDDAELLLRSLRRGGYELTAQRVASSEEVCAALDHSTWDLVISDYVMPGFGGLEALDLCKQRGLEAPFIIVSGHIGEEVAVAALKAGANDYVMKDRLARLGPAIERALQESWIARAHKRANEALRENEGRLRKSNDELSRARAELEKRDLHLSANARHQLGRERFLAYLAFTRARRRLLLTAALFDVNGSALNISPLLRQIQRLFPEVELETNPASLDWREAEHTNELILPLLRGRRESVGYRVSREAESGGGNGFDQLMRLPALAAVLERLGHFPPAQKEEALSPALAAKLYGPILRTSVSRMEQFSACPFKFFVHSGLRAEERKRFELDIKEQGTFQHDVLAMFHEQLRRENKRWHDISPREARELIARVATAVAATYRDGLLRESLQDFIETLVGWMRTQYRFDPVAVEIAFGHEPENSSGEMDLGEGRRLILQGRIDRVDVSGAGDEKRVVVVDYKSGQRRLEPVLLANGLQLQLLAYLNVLRRWQDTVELFGAKRLIPTGVFYVSLRGKYEREANRRAALKDTEEARQLAYRHTGRFDIGALALLDGRPDVREGDQFNFRLTNNGKLHKNCQEALSTAEFEALLDLVESNLKEMGQRIYAGVAAVSPYRKGSTTACEQCDYRGICRIDPWSHRFRLLRKS